MYLIPENKKVEAKPAPAEANPFRRAVFVVPILRAWLPLPLNSEAILEAQPMTQNFENSLRCRLCGNQTLNTISFLPTLKKAIFPY